MFSPDNHTLFVGNEGGDIVVVDLMNDMKVLARNLVGTTPMGGGIRYVNGK